MRFRQTQRPATTAAFREPGLRAVSALQATLQPGGGRATHTQVRQLPVQQAQTSPQEEITERY